MLPDHQGTAWFLTDAEKRAAVEMVRHNHTGIHNNNFRSGQLWEALTDVKTWAFFLMATIWNVPNSIATVSTTLNADIHVLGTKHLKCTRCDDERLGLTPEP